jgi:hypothetical protein
VVLGAAFIVVGVLGLAFGWGSTAPATPRNVATTVAARAEDPQTFLNAFVSALRTNDRSFLFARMHPAVIARYGQAQCEAFTAQPPDPNSTLRLVRVSAPSSYDYASDGRSTRISDVYTFTVEGTVAGATGTHQYHFALVDGRFRYFVDCGDPVPGS